MPSVLAWNVFVHHKVLGVEGEVKAYQEEGVVAAGGDADVVFAVRLTWISSQRIALAQIRMRSNA